jgi:hypothetical protein
VQKDEHKEFADVHDPLGLLNNLIAGQENTSSTSFHPHVTGSYYPSTCGGKPCVPETYSRSASQ